MRSLPQFETISWRRAKPACTTGAALAGAMAFALVLGAPAPARAQTVRLEDVIAAALKGNPLTQHEDEKVRRANGLLQQAQGAFSWTAATETGVQQLYVPRAENGVLTTKLDTPQVVTTTLGVGKLFRNGIQVQPGVSLAVDSQELAGRSFGLTQPRPMLNLTVPLFRGWGENNLPASTERAAAVAREGAVYNREFVGENSVTVAVQIYWRCLAARQALQVLDADSRGANDYVATLRDLVARGQIEQTLLDRAVANQAVQQVQVAKGQTADQLCRRDLSVAMGNSTAGTLPTPVGDFPAMDGVNRQADLLNEQALADTALIRRQDIMALSRFEAAEGERVKGAQNGVRPQVDIFIDPQRVMLRYSQSLGPSAQEGALSAAVAAEGEARINLGQLQTQIRSDIAEQVRNLRESLLSWKTLTDSVALLENVVADAQSRSLAGIITQQQYRDTENELAQVRRQVIDAKLEYASSLAALRLATGTVEAGDDATAEKLAAVFRTLPGQ